MAEHSRLPRLGQGTWKMGEDARKRPEEADALRLGLDLGMTLIDTAEMYGEGGAEEVIGDAIGGRRPEVLLVSKVYPHNATREGTVRACERSLRRLRTDYLDWYLLHWRGSVPLDQSLEGFQRLKSAGKIREYGVSNFDVEDLGEVMAVPGGNQIVTDQVLYNLAHRGIEWDLLPWCTERGMPVMAYSPIEHAARPQKRMLDNPAVRAVAQRHEATPVQIALAWVLRHDGVVPIPKSGNKDHVRENHASLSIRLDEQDLSELDRAFPPPQGKVPLEMR